MDGSHDDLIRPEGMPKYVPPDPWAAADPMVGRDCPWTDEEQDDEGVESESSSDTSSSSSSSGSDLAEGMESGSESDSSSE